MKNRTKENKRGLTLSLIIFILLILIVSPMKDKIQDLVGFKEKDLEALLSIDFNFQEDMEVRSYEKEVLVVDNEKITSYGYDNKKIWSKNINNQEDVYLGKSGFFINSKQNMSITKYDLNGKDLWSYNIKHPAYTVTEIENYLFIYSKVDKNTRGVTVLNKNGKLILDKEKNKEEILSSNISKDKKKFIITGIDTSSPDLKSKVTYLKDNGEIIWTEDVNEKIIYNVMFLDGNRMLLIGDKEIICKDDNGETLWQREIKYNLKDIEVVKGSEIYILYGIDDSYLEVLNIDGKLEYKKAFKKEYKDIEQSDNHVLLIGKDGILGLKNKKISMKNDIQSDAKQIQKSEDKILVVTNNKIDIFKVIDKKNK